MALLLGFLGAAVCVYWEPLMGTALFSMPSSKAWVLEVSLQGQEETKKDKMYLIVRSAV